MESTFLSKSKYCNAVQCNKILWLDKNRKEFCKSSTKESILKNGKEVGELARGIFGEYTNIAFSKNFSNMILNTKTAIENKIRIITEASFNYEGNFCSIDILKNDIDGIEIYEVKSSTEIRDIYIDDVSYQLYILLGLGYCVKKVCIVYINNQYERKGDLELDKLFNIEDVTEIAFSKQDEVKIKIQEINKYMQHEDEPDTDIDTYCFKPYECPYWEYCTRNLPSNNVFKIASMQTKTKFKFYKRNIIDFKDLLDADLSQKYKEQIEFEVLNRSPKIDKSKIKSFLDDLYYPLYFLDFETYQQSIPKYDGIRPYEQIPFQYSLHYIENEGGKLKHKEYLAKPDTDSRYEIALRLITDIPENACVIAYNMQFEKMVIKRLASLFKEFTEKLNKINSNMKDLMIPFKNRAYYTKEMQGSYSIKYVLPALFPNDPELDYHNLPVVHNGGEAMNIFAELGKYPKEEQEIIRFGLLKYCELDTYAMVKILEKLNSLFR